VEHHVPCQNLRVATVYIFSLTLGIKVPKNVAQLYLLMFKPYLTVNMAVFWVVAQCCCFTECALLNFVIITRISMLFLNLS
jgi:hypothetical protein